MAWRAALRFAIPGAVIIGLVAVALQPPALRVDTDTLSTGSVRETFEAEGRTRVRDRFEISAPILAQARRLTLEPGDTVSSGQALAVLDPVMAPSLDARAVAQAEARIAVAEARVDALAALADAALVESERALSEYYRLLRLFEQQLVTDEQMDRVQAQRRQAERQATSARYEQAAAEHELAAARAVLSHGGRPDAELVLAAPIDGTVLRRFAESARTVQPGEVLLEIGDPGALEIAVDVLSTDAVRLSPGKLVEVLRWGGTGPLRGVVRRIEPAGFTKISALGVEEQRVWVIVDLLSDHSEWSRLGDGYRVNARFVLSESEDTLRLPQSALFQSETGALAVFRVQDQRARRTLVAIGLRGDRWVEVSDGLQAGDRVILHPPRDLGDGQRVRW